MYEFMIEFTLSNNSEYEIQWNQWLSRTDSISRMNQNYEIKIKSNQFK